MAGDEVIETKLIKFMKSSFSCTFLVAETFIFSD